MKFCKQCNCFLPTSEEKHVGLCLEHIELRDESLGITESDRRAEHSNMKRKTLYGICPECGSPGVSRERRVNGDDKCSNGHKYPSANAK